MKTETVGEGVTLEGRVRAMAHSLPPSDLGSTRAIQAITAFVVSEQTDLVEALQEARTVLSGCPRESVGAAVYLQIDAALSKALNTPVSGGNDG